MASRTDPTEFVITVLEGPFAGDELVLTGRSAPYRAGAGGSISFGGTQRSKVVWYQGNPRGTHLIFGPTIDGTTINGVWKDRYLGDEAAIDLAEAFEEIRDSGVQVRVEWSTIERQGIIKGFVYKPGDPVGGLGDIAWEMIFEWNSKGEPPSRIVQPPSTSLRDSIASSASSFNGLRDLVSTFISLSSSFVGTTDIAFLSAKETLNDLIDASEPAAKAVATDASKLGDDQLLDLLVVEDASAQLGQVMSTSSQIGDLISNLFAAIPSKQDDVDILLLALLDRIDIVEETIAVMEDAFETRYLLEQFSKPSSFATIPVSLGTDLRSIARDFYGDSDLWDRIAVANGLDGSLVPAEIFEIVVPLDLPDVLSTQRGTVGA